MEIEKAMTTIQMKSAESAIEKLGDVETTLNDFFYERDEVIHTSLLALITQLNHFQIGPPGAAKTMIAEALGKGIVGANYFYKLLSKSIPVDEILGPTSLKGIEEEDFRRAIDGFLPSSDIAMLDEVYKAGDAVCNPTLRMMNERKYRNGRTNIDVPLICVFGASNELYDGPALDAFHSRWTFKHEVDYVSEKESFTSMITSTRQRSSVDISHIGLEIEELRSAHELMKTISLPDQCVEVLWNLRDSFRQEDIIVDDRKMVWIAREVLPAEALIQGRDYVDIEDFAVLAHCLWDDIKDRDRIRAMILKIANPLKDEIDRLVSAARGALKTAQKVVAESKGDETARIQAGADAQSDVKDILDNLNNRLQTSTGKAQTIVERALKTVRKTDERIIREVLRIRIGDGS